MGLIYVCQKSVLYVVQISVLHVVPHVNRRMEVNNDDCPPPSPGHHTETTTSLPPSPTTEFSNQIYLFAISIFAQC